MLSELMIETPPRPQPIQFHAPTTAELIDETSARAQLYRLLGGVFVEEASAGFISALRSDLSLASLDQMGVFFDADFVETPLADLEERLREEYTALFVATGAFPPVESARLTGRFQQGPYFDVKKIYQKAGFVVEGARFKVFEDQLGVELMFVAELLERAVAAMQAGDLAERTRLEREIKRFWVQHLGRWVRGYAQLIQRAAEHSFYRGMAGLLLAFAESEIEAMGLRLDDVDQARLVVPKLEVKVEVNPDEPVCGGCGVAGLDFEPKPA
jgi:TorA maturation chaperone TorD